jgi:glucose/arabinose dehydrogenase
MIIDLAVGTDGIYVLEHDVDGLLAPGSEGRLTRVQANGTRTVIASAGLTRPGGVAIGPDGALHVSTNSSAACAGGVVRIPRP